MKRLSSEAFERACHFLRTEARALDRALFEYHFEGGSAQAVEGALAAYRNADGGFGRALEPDLRTPSSSAVATGLALQVLKEIGYPAGHYLVLGAVRYLLDTFDHEQHVWRIVSHEANDYPHAPWWHDEDGSLARMFDNFLIMPRARLVGLLYHFSAALPAAGIPSDWLEQVTERTVVSVEATQVLGAAGGDDLVFALSLAQEPALPGRYRRRLLDRLRPAVADAVSRDPAEWADYSLRPLKIVYAPDSPVAGLIADVIQAELDYQIEHQTAAGTWDPVWSWGPAYPEAWQQARHEWRGQVTLETLTTLRAFGRIEEE